MGRIGRPPTENPRKRQLAFKVTAEEHEVIKRLAAEHGWTASDWLRAVMVAAALASREPRKYGQLMLDFREDLAVVHEVMERASAGTRPKGAASRG